MTTKRLFLAAAVLAALSFVASTSQAAPLNWTIDSSQSYVTLMIPNQNVTYDGIALNARIANQGAAANSATWNTGNKAQVSGSLGVDFNIANGTVQLTNAGTSSAVESGSWTPNPAVWNGTTYTDASKAPAAYALQINANAFVLVNIKVGLVAFSDVNYASTSGVLPVSGGGAGGTFSVNGTGFGLSQGQLDLKGLDPTVLGSTIDIPDVQTSFGGSSLLGTNNATTLGNITRVGNAATIKLPLRIPVALPLEIDSATTLNISMTASGFIVATTAALPEPGSVILALLGCIGFLPLAIHSAKKRRK